MTGRHVDPRTPLDVEPLADFDGLTLGGGRDFDTVAERRTRLGLPRPAHSKPATVMGHRLADLAPLIPYVADGLEAAAEIQLAVDRVRAMFDEQRAEALINRAADEASATPEPLAAAIHRNADKAARRDHAMAKANRYFGPRHHNAPCSVEPVLPDTIDPPTTEKEDDA